MNRKLHSPVLYVGILAVALCGLPATAPVAFAAIPLRWNVDTSRVAPVTFEAYHGETLALEASFFDRSTPLEGSFVGTLYWQTNGMENAYWSTNTVTVLTNHASALFLGSFDPGAPAVRGFIALREAGTSVTGQNYRAAFTLRFRPSPGYEPSTLPLPTPAIDCATTAFINPDDAPFALKGGSGGGVNTNAVRDIASALDVAATNALSTTLRSAIAASAASSTNYANKVKSQAISSAASSAASIYYRKDGGDISGNVRITKNSTTTLTLGNTANETLNATSPYETVFDSYGNITIKFYYGGTYEMYFPLKNGALMVDSDVPSWAKAATKPTYTAAEVGAATPAQLVAATNATLIAAKAYTDEHGGSASGLNLHDSVLGCDWQLSVTNAIFTWTVKEPNND